MEYSSAEFDLMGNNVGIRNPYTGQGSPNEPPPELQNSRGQAYEDSDNHIAGQRRTCQMDGMRVPCSIAERALDRGSAIPAALEGYQHLRGFKFESAGVGVYKSFIPGHYVRFKPDTDDGETIKINTEWVAASWETFSVQDIYAHEAPDRKRLSFLDEVILKKKVTELLTPECRDYIKTLLAKAQQFSTSRQKNATKEEAKYLVQGALLSDDILGIFKSVSEQGGFYGSAMANVATVTGKIEKGTATVYLASFWGWSGEQVARTWGRSDKEIFDSCNRVMTERAATAIHELIHFNFDDIVMANAVAAVKKDNKYYGPGQTNAASDYWGDELKKQLLSGCKSNQ